MEIYYYRARWYDPAIGRFMQADSILPEPGSPLAFDRYAYSYNNPVKYVDPSGRFVCANAYGICTPNDPMPSPELGQPTVLQFSTDDEGTDWTLSELLHVQEMTYRVGASLAKEINRQNYRLFLNGELDKFNAISFREALLRVYGGPILFTRSFETPGWGGYTASSVHIILYNDLTGFDQPYFVRHPGVIVHELGHALNNAFGKEPQDVPGFLLRALDAKGYIDHGDALNFYYGYAGGFHTWQFGKYIPHRGSEEFADMFVGWVFNNFNQYGQGPERKAYMDQVMSGLLSSLGQ